MARPGTTALVLAILFVLCYCVHGKSRRFGAVSNTLHLPPLTGGERLGENFMVVHAEEELKSAGGDRVDDVDILLKRFRRDATGVSGTINKTMAELNDSHNMLIVHWAGKASSVIIALAKSSSHAIEQTSSAFVSRDYGETFSEITANVTGPSYSTAVLHKYYNSDLRNSHYVFTALNRKCVFTTRNYAQTFTRRCDLPFTPKTISLNPHNVDHILGYDEDAPNSPLYFSEDFGQTWRLMREDVKSFFWGERPYDAENTVYVEEKRGSGGSAVLRSQHYFAGDDYEHVIQGVEDFQLQDEYMFATKRQRLFGSRDRNGTLQFWVSYHRGDFVNAQFPINHGHSDYYLADASEGVVMVCVVHNTSDTNLYISDVHGSRFSLSLEHIVYFNPKGANKDTWLSFFYNESFADIHKVAGLRGIYIASQLISSNGSFTVENQRSLITYDKGGEWELLNSPNVLHGRSNRNCSKHLNCSLHLSQEFTRLYPGSQAQPILSRTSAPGMIMASGTVGKSLKSQQDLFVSHDAGFTWYQVMDGNYIFSMADHGGVMLAAQQFQPTDSIYYSINEGESWHQYKFEDDAVRIYGILTEPGEKTTVFSVFGSKPDHHSWRLYQLNVSGLFDAKCVSDDYKDWSLPDTYPDAGCLLGQKLVLKRRIAHVPCFNGENFVPVRDLRNCSCTRDDFECDFGFKPRMTYSGNRCVRDNSVNNSLVNQVPRPCPPGTFYSYTRGYRRVGGDTCLGGEDHRYAPRRFSCPVNERNEFILVAGRTRIQSVDIDHYRAVDLYTVPRGQRGRINAVAFDYVADQLFWSTVDPSVIHSVSLNISHNRTTRTLAEGRMGRVTSLAFDWTAKTLYWSDEGERVIEMMLSDGSFRRRVIANNSRLIRPTRLVLDPVHGWMYWLESSQGRVMRAWMNGDASSIGPLTESHLSFSRQGLTLDLIHEQLFYTASNNHIGRIELGSNSTNSTNSTNLPLPNQSVLSPGLIAVYKEDLFWINNVDNQLMSAPSHGEEVALPMKTLTFTVVDMMVVSHITQGAKGACSQNSAPCSQLCAPRPHPTDDSSHNRTCRCGDEFSYEVHASGDQQCHCEGREVIHDGFCQRRNGTTTCNSDQFACNHGRCIPGHWQCDRDDDCGDMSDETDCPYYTCPSTSFTCNTGKCIPARWQCDFDNDCGNYEDEQNCTYPACDSTQFQCNNSRCIRMEYVCDMDDDCRDGSDENNCTNGTTCHSWEFTCDSGECLSFSQKCNGIRNCRDGSDERNCSTVAPTCNSWQFTCNNSRCIFRSWVCDGDNDCGDYSDERGNCSRRNSTTTPSTTTPGNRTCGWYEFTCTSGFCVDLSSVCDHMDDCGDNSDEEYCDFTTTSSSPSTCRYNQFTCNSGQCIPMDKRCDSHYWDCWDNSDELDCHAQSCPANHFECYESTAGDTHCIWGSWECDGEEDCRNGEDERNCNASVSTCPSNYFMCVRSGGCVPPNRRCDGIPDCGDHTDERDCKGNCDLYMNDTRLCCQHGCAYLDCSAESVSGCFPNETSIGSLCSVNNNNLCNNGTVTPSKPHDRTHYFQCPRVGSWIPWMYVCNGGGDCPNDADEDLCNTSDMSYVQLHSIEVTNTSISLYWSNFIYWFMASGPGADDYIVSYFPKDNVSAWTNETAGINKTSYVLKNLNPVTEYVISVYRKNGYQIDYPSRPLHVTTKEGRPDPPRNVKVSKKLYDETDSVVLKWDAPAHRNSYTIHYTIEVSDSDGSPSYTKDTDELSIRLFLSVNHNYTFKLRAVSSQGFGSVAVTKTFAYYLGRLQPLTLTSGTVTDNSVVLSWNKRSEATSYQVTTVIPYQQGRRIVNVTTDITFTMTGLCPGQTVMFSVEAEYAENQSSLPSAPLTITTTGTKHGAVTGLTAKTVEKRSVMIGFNPPANTKIKQYTVYYIEDSEPDLETFFKRAERQTTTDTTVTVKNLNACERYFFRVGCGPDSCPISNAFTSHTGEDDQGPPKHLKYQMIYSNKGNKVPVQLKVTWNAPCDSLAQQLNYMMQISWAGQPNGRKVLLPKASRNTSLSYLWRNVTRGETYHFKIRTNVANSQYSKELVVTIPPFPAPEGFILIQEPNSMVRMQWEAPKDLPAGNLFKGYNVSISREKQVVETKIVRETSLHQNVTPGYMYTVAISVAVANGPNGKALTYQFPYYLEEPNSGGLVSMSKNNLVAILVPVGVVLVVLVAVVTVFVIRHRRLQRSFLAFANSHYNTRSGTTTFSSDLDDDEPMIQGFSDDEPLVLA